MPKLVKTDKKSMSHISLSIEPELKERFANIAYSRGLRSVSLLIQQIAKGQVVLFDKNAVPKENTEVIDIIERLEEKIEDLSRKVEDLTYEVKKQR